MNVFQGGRMELWVIYSLSDLRYEGLGVENTFEETGLIFKIDVS